MISINLYEIIFQIVNFIILLLILKRILAKPLSTFLQNRANTIKYSIEKSDANRAESSRLLEEQKSLLKKAYLDAQEIRSKSEESAKKEKEASVIAAKENAQQIMKNAKRDIENEFNSAKKELIQQVGKISLSLSERILSKNISTPENKNLITAYMESTKK